MQLVLIIQNVRSRSHRSFVSRRSVYRRDGDVVQSEIDRELAAVVDDVVEDEGPHDGDFWHCEIDLFTVSHRPVSEKRFVGRFAENCLCFFDMVVEEIDFNAFADTGYF